MDTDLTTLKPRELNLLHLRAFPNVRPGQILVVRVDNPDWNLWRDSPKRLTLLMMRCSHKIDRWGYAPLNGRGHVNWHKYAKPSRLFVTHGVHPVNDFQPTSFTGPNIRWVTPKLMQAMVDTLLDPKERGGDALFN